MNSNKSTDLASISDSKVQSTSPLEALFMTYNQLLHSSGENLTTAGKPYDYDSLFANSHQALEQALALLNNDSVAVAGAAAATATAASTIADDSLFNATKSISRLVEVSDLSRTIMVTIYLLTAVIAFVVNFFALLILFYGRRKSRQLNRFLSNLGFSDIIFAIFNIPFTYITLIYNTWWLPEILCPFTSFVQVLAPTVAFYTLIAIGIGRYYVIVTGQECHFLTKSTKFVICIIWLFAVIVALPNLFVSQIKPVTFENTSYVECTEDWSFVAGTFENQSAGTIYTIIVFVLTFILPVVALTYLYGRIGIIVYKHQLPVGNDSRVTNQNLTQTKIKVVKMLLLLVISFIVCWSPVQIFYLILWVFEDIRRDTGGEDGDSADSTSTSYYSIIYYSMYFIFHWLSCSHTIINPFIYCFFSNNFQKNELIDILCCKVSCNNRRRRSINHCTSIANNNNSNFVHSNNHNNNNKDNPNNSNNSTCNLKQLSPVNQEYWGHRDNLHKAQMRKPPSPSNHQSVITIKDSINDHNHSRRSSNSSSPNHV